MSTPASTTWVSIVGRARGTTNVLTMWAVTASTMSAPTMNPKRCTKVTVPSRLCSWPCAGHTTMLPVTQATVPPPTQIAPASSWSMCTRPARPRAVPWLTT